MGKLLYNIILQLYHWGIRVASFFNPKAKQWVEGRKDWQQAMQTAQLSNVVWVHSASLGEFEQARPLIEKIKKDRPEKDIVISFFSPSGYEIRKNYPLASKVCYLPIDSQQNAQAFLDLLNPSLIIWIKYDFWYHYLVESQKRHIPLILVAGIFRPNQFYFKSYGRFMQEALNAFTQMFVQNKSSFDLLQQHQFQQIQIAPDTRFDRVYQNAQSPQNIPIVEKFKFNKPLFVAGSTWDKDIEVLLPLIKQYQNEIQFLIAPHEINEGAMRSLQEKLGPQTLRFTQVKEQDVKVANVLILDTIGLLSAAYQYANFAYIGGGFGKGIHNILEAAVFEIPVFFGPKHQKFQEAKDLLSLNAVFAVQNAKELLTYFEATKTAEKQKEIKQKLAKYVANNVGGTQQIYEYLTKNVL